MVSGYVWKLIRESTGLTQQGFAETFGIDIASVQGWESGRRPLSAVRSGDLARLRIQLIRRGVSPKLFAVLNDALEADLVINYAIGAGGKVGPPDHHPLAATVHRRDLTNLITWPFNGILPTQLRELINPGRPKRRGPSPTQPNLGADETSRFFEHLRAVADRCRDNQENLLRRQSVYLLSFDTADGTRQWLLQEHTRAVHQAGRAASSVTWSAVRSAAIGLTRYGQKEPLQAFVASGLRNHHHEVANLNYWAYWLGEVRDIHIDDSFMHDVHPSSWDGAHLLSHLINRINPEADQLDLNVRTLWQLLLARPYLLTERPELRALVSARVTETLDCHDLEKQARQEFSDVAYAIRLASR